MHSLPEILPLLRLFSSDIEHREYFPYGEVWVNERSSAENHVLPYKYTGKEYDPETKLTYYGARYYDAKLSRWISVDPPLISGEYLPNLTDKLSLSAQGKQYKPEIDLPGMGGVFNPFNLDGYQFTHNNPVKYVDPDGNASYHFDKDNHTITIKPESGIIGKLKNIFSNPNCYYIPNSKRGTKIDYTTSDYIAIAIYAYTYGGEYKSDGSLVLKKQSSQNLETIKAKVEFSRKQILWSNYIGRPSMKTDEKDHIEMKYRIKTGEAVIRLFESKPLFFYNKHNTIRFDVNWLYQQWKDDKSSGIEINSNIYRDNGILD